MVTTRAVGYACPPATTMEVSATARMIVDKWSGTTSRRDRGRSRRAAISSAFALACICGTPVRPGDQLLDRGQKGPGNSGWLLRAVARLMPATIQATTAFPIGLLRAMGSTAGDVGSVKASGSQIGFPDTDRDELGQASCVSGHVDLSAA